MRRTFLVQQTDGTRCPIGELAPTPGWKRFLTGVTVAGIATNVVAVWSHRSKEPWLLITDLAPTFKRCLEYRRRTWEEQLFRDLKSLGWGWEQSRVRQPRRVERLLLVLAVATLWMIALGGRLIREGRRHLVEDRLGHFSRFRLGSAFVDRLLANDEPVPCVFHLVSTRYAT